MKELIGEDLFDQIGKADAICITTNCTILDDGSNPMGGGCAGAAARRWSNIPWWYGRLLQTVGHVPVIVGLEFVDSPNDLHALSWYPKLTTQYDRDQYTYIVMYPTMHSIMEPASLDLVVRSAQLLSEMADTKGWRHVVVPRPGAGIGSLDWATEVKPALESVLDDRFILIHKDFARPKASMTWTATSFYGDDNDDN